MISRVKTFFSRLKKDKFSRLMMLKSRIDVLKVNSAGGDNTAKKSALAYGTLAEEALQSDQFERAWRNVVAGEAEVLRGQSDDEVRARSRAIAAEITSVLPASDATGILKVLPEIAPDGQPHPDWKAAVAEAYSLYQHRVIQLMDARERTGTRVCWLGLILTLLLALLLSTASCHPEILQSAWKRADSESADSIARIPVTFWLLLAMATLGAIGACLSALISLTVLRQAPGQFESFSTTVARPLVGAASGLISTFVCTSSLVTVDSTSALAVVAFGFGFSERLIIGAVQRFEAGQK